MNQIVLSDEALKQAAASVRRAMLDSLPSPAECEHAFSPAFRDKMKKLIAKYDLRRSFRKTMQRAAMFALAALLSLTAWLGVDAQAREAFFSWVREVYEEHIVYRFFGEPAAEDLPAYRITWLPEGYEEVDVYSDNVAYNAFYQKGDDIMSAFVFEYFFAQDSSAIGLLTSETGAEHKTVNINGLSADYYQSSVPGETNNLIWILEDANIAFTLNGFPEESVMVHIAESVILTDPTN